MNCYQGLYQHSSQAEHKSDPTRIRGNLFTSVFLAPISPGISRNCPVSSRIRILFPSFAVASHNWPLIIHFCSVFGYLDWKPPVHYSFLLANSYGAYAERLQINVSGSLTVSEKGLFDFALDKVEINDGYTPIFFGLTLVIGSGAARPLPQSTQNIFKLTEDEFYQAYTTCLSAVMTLIKLESPDHGR